MNTVFKDYYWTINTHLGIKYQHAGFKNYLEKYPAGFAYMDFRSKFMRDRISFVSDLVGLRNGLCSSWGLYEFAAGECGDIYRARNQILSGSGRISPQMMCDTNGSGSSFLCPCTTHPWCHSLLSWCPRTATHDVTPFALLSLTNEVLRWRCVYFPLQWVRIRWPRAVTHIADVLEMDKWVTLTPARKHRDRENWHCYIHNTTVIFSSSLYRKIHLLNTVSKYRRILAKVCCLAFLKPIFIDRI